jgi:quinohemoprotein ethanol dehydrogenase
VDVPGFEVDPEKASLGVQTYAESCVLCHGGGVVSGGGAPDLRASPLTREYPAFKAVMVSGVMEKGMPRFPNFDDATHEALFHYIRREARKGATNASAMAPR